MNLKAADRRRINEALCDLCKESHESIPLDRLTSILTSAGLRFKDEGFVLTGRDGRATFDLLDTNDEDVANSMLVLTWYKRERTWEINSYLS